MEIKKRAEEGWLNRIFRPASPGRTPGDKNSETKESGGDAKTQEDKRTIRGVGGQDEMREFGKRRVLWHPLNRDSSSKQYENLINGKNGGPVDVLTEERNKNGRKTTGSCVPTGDVDNRDAVLQP